ncbi:MAG: hypothetical protein HYT79_05655 [Elusimicrobia bacterium]|nr:hypothetical protein [Elusimicrobiota bacterium]
MPSVVKKAISLRSEQDRKIQEIAKRAKAPYSVVIQKAVDFYLSFRESRRMEEAYRSYYSLPENENRERHLVRDWQDAGLEDWPD